MNTKTSSKWECKKHGKNCDSYAKGLVGELNRTGRKPTEDELKLVRKSQKEVRER